MSVTLQEFLSKATDETAKALQEALARIPEDKRQWAPQGQARTAADMLAECALLNANAADSIINKVIDPNMDFEKYFQDKAKLAGDYDRAMVLLQENSKLVVDAIAKTADDDLGITIQSPWGPMPFTTNLSYAYWNMSYHLGQVNYIASMLGTLD